MKVEEYLRRFDATSLTNVSLDQLAQLQNLHLESIPFENLDVIRKVPIYLTLEHIYKKVVHRYRGGYCYELNGLLHWLLKELRYDAHLVAATVLRKTGEWAKTDTHAAIIVYLDQPYLVDVGFGTATPRIPVPLNGRETTDVRATYRIVKYDDRFFDLMRKNKTDERILYRFNTEKKELIDFHEECVFNQVSKESTFTHSDIITRSTATGQITLTDQTLTVIENNVQQKEHLSADEKMRVLQNDFNIQFDE